MSTQYDNYLEQHKEGVMKAYEWLMANLPDVIQGRYDYEWQIATHDHSKNQHSEYDAYDAYFYGGNRSAKVVEEFNKAWLLHIHRNPHHWQHWVLINDDPNEGEIILDMPYNYIIEMICDWWSFSWRQGKLDEIFKWYDEHKDYIKLSTRTRDIVESILDKIKAKLEEIKTLESIADEFNKIGTVNAVSLNELRNALERSADSQEN